MLNVQLSSTLYYDREGQPAGNIVILRDISAQKRAEKELKKYVIIFLSSIAFLTLAFIYHTYNKNHQLIQKIKQLDKLMQKTSKIIDDYDNIKTKQAALEKLLSENKDFNIRTYFEKFIKDKMEKELGLVENPTETQLEEIIHRKVKRKPKGKTVFFRDFINEMPSEGADLPDTDLMDDIIDAEIIEEPICIKSDNEL